ALGRKNAFGADPPPPCAAALVIPEMERMLLCDVATRQIRKMLAKGQSAVWHDLHCQPRRYARPASQSEFRPVIVRLKVELERGIFLEAAAPLLTDGPHRTQDVIRVHAAYIADETAVESRFDAELGSILAVRFRSQFGCGEHAGA